MLSEKLALPQVADAGAQSPQFRMELNETVLIDRLQQQDEAAFEQVFKKNFRSLHGYACTMVKDVQVAEEMVQNVFLRLWEKAARLNIAGSVEAYLFRAVHNECLNHLKHLKVREAHKLYVSHRSEHASGELPAKQLQAKEIESRLSAALAELPEQCRTIFQLSRFEELRYREIADTLGISVKTVENQMGKALRILRTKLVDLMTLILLFTTSKF